MSIIADFPLERQTMADPMEKAVESMTDCQERAFTHMRRLAVRAKVSSDERFLAEYAALSATISELCDHFAAVMEQTEQSFTEE